MLSQTTMTVESNEQSLALAQGRVRTRLLRQTQYDAVSSTVMKSGVFELTFKLDDSMGLIEALPLSCNKRAVKMAASASASDVNPLPPLIPSPSGAEYHTRVRHSGWVLKHTSRLRTRLVRRFFRLTNSMLSNSHDEGSDPTWVISVSNSIVRAIEERCTIVVRLADRELRFQLENAPSTAMWLSVLRSASRCNIIDFYSLGAQLGFGSFGAVRLATEIGTGVTRAVKIVERTSNVKEREFITREIAVMLSVSHPNLVRTHDIFDGTCSLHSLFYCVNDSLTH